MNRSLTRSRYESALAAAHRALHRAADVAEELHDAGAAADIELMSRHLSVMLTESLKDRALAESRQLKLVS